MASSSQLPESDSPAGETHAVLDQRAFAELLEGQADALRAYILAMVGNRADAEDVFQATSLQLWQERHRFRPGTNFGGWAAKVAYYNVLTFRKRRQRERRRLAFSDEFVDVVGAREDMFQQAVDRRREALRHCLETLDARQKNLLTLRYAQSASVELIASALDRSAQGVYKALSRLRAALANCIKRQLSKEAL